MTDRVLIPFGPDVLALTSEQFEEAREAGHRLMGRDAPAPSPTAPHGALLVSAEEMGRLTDTTPSWWESAARDADCPSVFVGRVRRFNVEACMRWLERSQEMDGAGRVKRCAVAPRARS